MSYKKKTETESQRRRGRPSGRNRTPLSLEEKRARNALYERERRNETTEAFLQLAEAAGCDRNLSNADLLATVISNIHRATDTNSSDKIDNLKRINNNLESQILTLQGRLGLNEPSLQLLQNETEDDHAATKQERDSDNISQHGNKASEKHITKRKRGINSVYQRKRRKLNSIRWSDDSGIESQSPQPESAPSGHNIAETPSLVIQYSQGIEEPVHRATQAQIDLNSELYRQLYSEPAGNGTASWNEDGTHTPYLMETLAQSLITIPSITPPQQDPPTWMSHVNMEPPDITVRMDMEPFAPDLMPLADRASDPQFSLVEMEHPDQSMQHESNIAQQIQPNLDLFTEAEKGMITEWILNEDFLASCDQSQLLGCAMNYTAGYS